MMKMGGKRVFISGPMSDSDDHHVDDFALAHDRLKKLGIELAFNPAILYLNQSRRLDDVKTHDDYMLDCIHELTRRQKRTEEWVDVIPMKYDVLVQLPGWEKSLGAKTEAEVAKACGIPCVSLEDCE